MQPCWLAAISHAHQQHHPATTSSLAVCSRGAKLSKETSLTTIPYKALSFFTTTHHQSDVAPWVQSLRKEAVHEYIELTSACCIRWLRHSALVEAQLLIMQRLTNSLDGNQADSSGQPYSGPADKDEWQQTLQLWQEVCCSAVCYCGLMHML